MKGYNNTQETSIYQPNMFIYDFQLSETTDSIHIYQTSPVYSMLVFGKNGQNGWVFR